DFILSWKILNSSFDFSGEYANVVNVVPVNNTTVDYYLSNSSGTFLTYTLETPILPYHIWVSHDYASSPGVWNYTTSLPAANSYNSWNVGYNAATGTATGLVGTGPFMFTNSYGLPQGKWIFDEYWKMYVNPHYFVQYVPSLKQWTPKFYELYVPKYLSMSAAVIALEKHQVYQIEGGVTPSFISTLANQPNIYLYYKPATGFRYLQFNSFDQNSSNYTSENYGFTPVEMGTPLNITSVRQALSYAINKQYIASVIFDGYDIPGTSLIPPSDSLWQNQSLPDFSYNPSEAMSLLNSTPGMSLNGGKYYYRGQPFTMNIQITSMNSDPLDVEAALQIAQWWDQIGVPTTVTQESFSTIVATENDYQFKATVDSITGIVGDPTDFFDVFYTPSGGLFYGLYFGPFTSMPEFGNSGPIENGTYFDNEMISLYNQLNSNTNTSYRIHLADEMQGIAAWEATVINLGYPIHIFPIENSTFVNITKDALGQNSFEFWNFLSLHMRSESISAVNASPSLRIGLSSPSNLYYNGQYGNITVEVRDPEGSPVSDASVVIGFSPEGSITNVSSLSGFTNATGAFNFEFKVPSSQSLIYTSDYSGEVNVSVSASLHGSPPVFGHLSFDVTPRPVFYRVLDLSNLYLGASPQIFKIQFYNPQTGDPIPNYTYDFQVNAGAINVTTPALEGQSVQLIPGNPSDELYYSTDFVNGSFVANYNMTEVSGATGENGTAWLYFDANKDLALNQSSNFTVSYIFLGNYALGSPMRSNENYMTIGEMTSSSNPNGFGEQQTVEIPVGISATPSPYSISLMNYTQNLTHPWSSTPLSLYVANNSRSPVPNVSLQISSQNVLGANRGFFSGDGIQVEGINPNELFGSTYLPSINITTNSTGEGQVIFNSSIYREVSYASEFVGFQGQNFSDPFLIPFDEFQITVVDYSADSVFTTTLYSGEYLNNPPPKIFLSGYISSLYGSGNTYILNATGVYILYINSTLGSIYGPNVGNVNFNLSVSRLGNEAQSLETGPNGTYLFRFQAPNVASVEPLTILISNAGNIQKINAYIVPLSHSTVEKIRESYVPIYAYVFVGILAILVVALAVLLAISRRGRAKN
ncbi:MAG: ABC transporter substrate-binding protein, partial [Thermoplasmatales archaeon]